MAAHHRWERGSECAVGAGGGGGVVKMGKSANLQISESANRRMDDWTDGRMDG
jgi:hypothetical protein